MFDFHSSQWIFKQLKERRNLMLINETNLVTTWFCERGLVLFYFLFYLFSLTVLQSFGFFVRVINWDNPCKLLGTALWCKFAFLLYYRSFLICPLYIYMHFSRHFFFIFINFVDVCSEMACVVISPAGYVTFCLLRLFRFVIVLSWS